MQGTLVMLMTLAGVGCHHKACDTGYVASACYVETACYAAPACYAATVATPQACYVAAWSGCYGSGQNVGYVSYAPACYATAYSACYSPTYSSCYGATYDACYGMAACYGGGSGCYGGSRHNHGGLFGCFKRKHCGVCNGGYNACYASWYDTACYSTPVFGSYTPTYMEGMIYTGPVTSGSMTSGQVIETRGVEQGMPTTAPSQDVVTPPSDTKPGDVEVPKAPDPRPPVTPPGTPETKPETPPAPEVGDLPKAAS